jgi:membrane associated rhomboid family serine protease
MNDFLALATAAPVATFIFIITIITSLVAFWSDDVYAGFVLHPYSVSRNNRVYTLITSGLIHNDWMHLFFNMLSYYYFAFALEAGFGDIPGIGHWQFAMLYIFSLILSDLPTVYKHKNDDWYHSLGASGAVSAVIFSAILYIPLQPMGFIGLPIRIPAVIFGALYLVYCNYASKRGRDNINHDAHFFGALSGMLITIFLHPHIVSSFFSQIIQGVQSLTR